MCWDALFYAIQANEKKMDQQTLKQQVAQAALEYIDEDMIIGVGTGSTVNCFIDVLSQVKHNIEGAVCSSKASAERIKKLGIPVLDPNSVMDIAVYIDGADEANHHLQLIKGGGAALTGEKIIAANSKRFICLIDESKFVDILGHFPLPVEVIPMARSYVARQLVKLGGDPMYRQGVTTDYGNLILDVHNLSILDPSDLEQRINQIAGVVSNGLFSQRRADVLLVAGQNGVKTLRLEK